MASKEGYQGRYAPSAPVKYWSKRARLVTQEFTKLAPDHRTPEVFLFGARCAGIPEPRAVSMIDLACSLLGTKVKV